MLQGGFDLALSEVVLVTYKTENLFGFQFPTSACLPSNLIPDIELLKSGYNVCDKLGGMWL